MGLGTFSGGGLGFGVAFHLRDEFSRTSEQIQRSMQGLGMSTDAMERRMSRAMDQMAVGAGLLGVGLAALMPLRSGLRIAGEFEQAKVGLETFLGSAERAQEVFNNIKADAKESATFDTAGLLAVNRALISAGLSAEQARIDTNNLANAVAAVGGGNAELQRMAVNMQQIKNVGKASALDIKQFAYAGINIYGLLAAEAGKTVEQVKDMEVTYELLSKALDRAAKEGGLYAGAAERQANTINGMLSNLEDNFAFAMAGIGEAVQKEFGMIVGFLSDALSWFAKFSNSPFGKWVIKITAAVAVLAVGMGALMVATNLARVSVYKLAGSFNDATKSAILQTIAQKGVIAGFRKMAAAAWASLGPYILIPIAVGAVIAIFYKLNKMLQSNEDRTRKWAFAILALMGPVGWLIGGVMALVQGMRDFDGYMNGTQKRLNGLAGKFQKLGGILRGVWEIIKSFDMKDGTFTFTEQLDKALDDLGIKETVLSIGTYIARAMAFFQGMGKGISWAFEKASEWVSKFLDWVGQAEVMLEGMGFEINKATSAVDKWRNIGEKFGKAFIVVLGLVLAAVVAIGVAMTLALVPFLIAATAIALPFILAYKAIMWCIEGVTSLINIIKELFTKGQEWFANSWLGKALGTIGINVGASGGTTQPASTVSPITPTSPVNGMGAMDNLTRNRAASTSNMSPYVNDKTEKVIQNLSFPINLDGDEIANKTIDLMNIKDNRNN